MTGRLKRETRQRANPCNFTSKAAAARRPTRWWYSTSARTRSPVTFPLQRMRGPADQRQRRQQRLPPSHSGVKVVVHNDSKQEEALFCVLETGRGTGLLAFLRVSYDGFI